ncbi:hypothetical protein L1987_78804 [Smallanthus sonchifolius]|uniref:Uncharacterized protein n=1 Tax=Smallanthus sonchifolius TaxID=185202 RepID=A0ACB8ZDX6_9ASTR|nr:hypothetical protein L1987_78804 [Smallanthus sonchifolius]
MWLHTESQHPNTINPQRFGQKYVSKELIFSKASKRAQGEVTSDMKTVIKSVIAELLSGCFQDFTDSISSCSDNDDIRLSASIAASTSVQSIATDEENIDSDSDDEPVQHEVNKLHYSSNYNNKLLFNISHQWIAPFQLKVVRLGSCKIEDRFPQWFQNQTELKELVLTNASISGPLPTWLHLLSSICVLDLSYNKLTGPLTNIPLMCHSKYEVDWKNSHVSMEFILGVLLLSSNRLSSVVLSPLGFQSSLRWLQLNDNNFKGEIPRDFQYFTNLIVWDLGENKISGDIPEWIGENITSLNALILHNNNFSGRIPHSLCKSRELRILDLAHNNLRGPIPHCFGEMDGMKVKSLYGFSLHFSGYVNISQVLKGVALDYTKTLKFITNMDLSSNKLVGEIPEALTALDALTLTDPSIYADNTYLCGAPLPKECSPHGNPTRKNKEEYANEPNKVWFYLDITCGFATGFWGIIGVLLFKKEWRHKLFMFCEVAMDKIYVAVTVRVLKTKRGCIDPLELK